MSTKNEIANYEGLEFADGELTPDELHEKLEAELDVMIADLAFLEEEREKIGNPDNLGKVILDEVWKQVGNQIGLDLTNETLIQEYDRKHPEEYNKQISDAILQDEKYQEANRAMKQQHQDGALVDGYTGKPLGVNDKPNLDHVVSRKELYDNARRKQANIDTADLANKEENLVPTNESLNKSKKEKSNQQYVEERVSREETLKKRADAAHEKIDESNKSQVEKRIEHENVDKRLQDKLDANDDLMLEADKKARKAIGKDVAIGATKQTVKKAGKDALKVMAIKALFDLLKSIMNGLVKFLKEKHKTFKLFLEEMKESLKRFIGHIASFVQTGITTAVGTVVTEIFGPIVSMFQKLASLIKQGITSFTAAIRYLTDKKNKSQPISIKIAQVGKIVTEGLVAAGAIIGGELIEKALLQIPVMATSIPVLGSLAYITGLFLASLVAGVIGAIVINLIDRYIARQQKNANLDMQIDKGNEILQTQDQLKNVSIYRMNETKAEFAQSTVERHVSFKNELSEAMTNIFSEEDDEDDTEEISRRTDEKIKTLLI